MRYRVENLEMYIKDSKVRLKKCRSCRYLIVIHTPKAMKYMGHVTRFLPYRDFFKSMGIKKFS